MPSKNLVTEILKIYYLHIHISYQKPPNGSNKICAQEYR